MFCLSTTSNQQSGPELGLITKDAIRGFRALTEEEYANYHRATSRLSQFIRDQLLFRIVHQNCVDFEKLVAQYLCEVVKNPRTGWQARYDMWALDADRHILNFLSSVRTFLDHSEFNLKKRYGNESERVRQFKEACSMAYDNEFAYRFLYHLRNYAQHCALPLGEFIVESKSAEGGDNEVVHDLRLYFKRDELLKEYDSWGKKLQAEIQSLPDRVEIMPYLRRMMVRIREINFIMLNADMPEINRCILGIKKLIDEAVQFGVGTPSILFFSRSSVKPGTVNVIIHSIPTRITEIVRTLSKVRDGS